VDVTAPIEDFDDPLASSFYNGTTRVKFKDARKADLDAADTWIKAKISKLQGNAKAFRSLGAILTKEGKETLGECADAKIPDLIKQAIEG
jgi:hypothetical protein